MKQPKIVGKDWALMFDEEAFVWRFAGDGLGIYRMVRDAFPPRALDEYERTSSAADHRAMGSLYEDVVAFLGEWGIKASIVGREAAISEDAPD